MITTNTDKIIAEIDKLNETIYEIEKSPIHLHSPLRVQRWETCVDTASIILGGKDVVVSFAMVTKLATELYLLKLLTPDSKREKEDA